MKRKLLSLALILILTALSAGLVGCVKVVKIGEEGTLTGNVDFSAGDSVAEVWESVALPELNEKAVELKAFLQEANGDIKSLVDKYGKYSMGTSGEINYVVKGSGTVEEINTEKKAGYMVVKLEGHTGSEIIKLQIGSVYKGSSVRDSLDFIKFGDYKNQQEWAAISQEMHSIIDKTIIKTLDLSTLKGKTIEFLGTFTAGSNEELLITPVAITVE